MVEVNLWRNGFEGDWLVFLMISLLVFVEDDGGCLCVLLFYLGIRIGELVVVLVYEIGWVGCEVKGFVVWVVVEVEVGEDDGEMMVGLIFLGRLFEGEIFMGLFVSVICWDICFDFE